MWGESGIEMVIMRIAGSFVDTVAQLSEALQERLENSWAGEFYREVFCRLDETIFERVYSDEPSRPNIPVNQLVGIEILKSDVPIWKREIYRDGSTEWMQGS